MSLVVKDALLMNQNNNGGGGGSLFLTAASTNNDQNTIDSIKNTKAKLMFIKLGQQQLQTTMNSDSMQNTKPLTLDQKIIQAQKYLRELQAQINLNSPRTTQAIHKLRLLPDSFKLKNEIEIEKFYRHKLERMQFSGENSEMQLGDQFDNDSDQETEKYPNNSRKRFYKHIKEVISRHEKAVVERQQIIREENNNLRLTVYDSGFQYKKFKKRDPLESIDIEYKLQQLSQKKLKQLEIIDRQTSIIFEKEFKYRQWKQNNELRTSESQQQIDTFNHKRLKQFKKLHEERQKRFQDAHEKQIQKEKKLSEKLKNELEKKDEKFQTFCSSKFEQFSTKNFDRERQKLDTLHRNQSMAQQKEDFKLHLLKMKQDERDRQGTQLVQELMNEKKKELKVKNDSKVVKISKANQIENEKQNTKLNTYLEKIENVNLRMSLKESEFTKLLEKQRKKQRENRDKYDNRVNKLDGLMEKQNEQLNHKDNQRLMQIQKSIELRDLESLRKGELLQMRLENNADNQNENWLKKQRRNDLIMERHKRVKENAIKIQQERNMLQEISMKNTLKLNTIKESLDYNLQMMKNDPLELLYLKYKNLNLPDELIDQFILNQTEDEEQTPEEAQKAEHEKPKQVHTSKKLQDIRFTLNPELLRQLEHQMSDDEYNTASKFKSLK